MDASSAILLCKANLHLIVSEMYNVVMSQSVYEEITDNSYPGAKEYQQLLADKKITVQVPIAGAVPDSVSCGLHKLGQGERDIIRLYYAGYGDFIMTDDGAAARYCKSEQIRFINALLIPKIIKCTGQQSDAYCQDAFDSVMSIGRYSSWVINFAEKCEREELSYYFTAEKSLRPAGALSESC